MLTFVIRPELLQKGSDGSHTKLLSIDISIFDPLGLLGFLNVHAKIIPQNVWRSGVNWDDAMKESDETDWMKWQAFLPKLNDLRIPRSSNFKSLQICAVYIHRGKEIRCSLSASKTRVAPLKPISVPRM